MHERKRNRRGVRNKEEREWRKGVGGGRMRSMVIRNCGDAGEIKL